MSAYKVRGILAVAAGFLIHLTLGTFFTFGNMTTYMTSFMYRRVDDTVDYSKAIWINALAYVGQGSLMLIGGILEKKIGARITCLIGCTIFSVSTMATYFSIQFSFALTAFLYGLSSGIGLGIAYVVPLVNGMKWFPERKGLVNGIIAGGYGMGALVFNQVQTVYLNSNNTSPALDDGYFDEDEVLDKVPSAFLLLGGVYAIMELIGIVLLFPAPIRRVAHYVINSEVTDETEVKVITNDCTKHNSDEKTKSQKAVFLIKDSDSKPGKNPADGIGIRAMLRKKEFYFLWMTFALNAQCILFINTMYKAFGQTFIHDDQFLSIVGSGASLFNALGRIVWGQLQDRFCYKNCMMALCCSLTLLMLTFVVTPYGGKYTFTIWVLAIFFSFSGLFALLPTATAQAFGPKNVGANYGLVFSGPAVSSMIGAQLVGVLQHHLGWFGSFCFVSSLSATAFGITLLFPKDPSVVLKRHFEPLKSVEKTEVEGN